MLTYPPHLNIKKLHQNTLFQNQQPQHYRCVIVIDTVTTLATHVKLQTGDTRHASAAPTLALNPPRASRVRASVLRPTRTRRHAILNPKLTTLRCNIASTGGTGVGFPPVHCHFHSFHVTSPIKMRFSRGRALNSSMARPASRIYGLTHILPPIGRYKVK